MSRRDGVPVWIGGGERATPLERARLAAGRTGEGYDEAWLQRLLRTCPEVFPIGQVEPGFGPLVPICRELPLEVGASSVALDNLMMTPDGGLVLIEAKLWRNPEARRKVVAQAMEYAAALFALGYEALQNAVARARRAEGMPAGGLYGIISERVPDLDEASFVDAVAQNLEKGRAVVAVVGDGIREDIVPIARLLQSHAGHRFTFALVELAVYDVGPDRLIVPSVLAQTTLVERGVVKIEQGGAGAPRITVSQPRDEAGRPATAARPMSISEDEFYEQLALRGAELPGLLKRFLPKAALLNIEPEVLRGMNLKHPSLTGNPLNLGVIDKDGQVELGPASYGGRLKAASSYHATMARLIGGSVRLTPSGVESTIRAAGGRIPRLTDFLPQHEDAWLDAMSAYVRELTAGGEEA